MEKIVEDPVDCYWLIKSFVSQFQAKFGDSLPHLVSAHQTEAFLLGRPPLTPACLCSRLQPKSLEHYLSQEEPRLLRHLRAVGALPQLPYGLWFRRCFAGCLPESSLQRSVSPAFSSIALSR